MSSLGRTFLLLTLLCLSVFSQFAQSADAKPVPESLQSWVDWVRDSADCPYIAGAKQETVCAWPHQLVLERSLDKAGLRFRQQWEVFDRGWIPLPGDSQSWPENVRIDGKPAVVISRQHRPFVFVDKGRLTLQGEFPGHDGKRAFWLPADVVLVRYLVAGVEQPVFLDDSGLLRFSPGKTATAVKLNQEKNSLTLKVFRHFRDDVPTEITTILRLTVSGKNRVVDFGRVTLPDSVPIQLQSRLRTSINERGELSAIVQSGTWDIRITAYYPHEQQRWWRGKAAVPFWPRNEYWYFQREPALYSTTLSGSPVIDPQSVDGPRQWNNLSAFIVAPNGGLEVKRVSRGTQASGETHATIERDLWMSFSGQSLFLRDQLTGEAKPYSSLVVASPDITPQAIYLDGKPQVMVRSDDGIGVSLRKRQLDATVLGTMDASEGYVMPANPYADLRAESIAARLHLPPGWRLLAVDSDIQGDTWLSQWSLYLVFLLLIVSIAFARVIGLGWGIFAAATLGITFHEPQTPVLLWLLLLGLVAVLRNGLGNYPRLTLFLQKLKSVVLLAIALMLAAYTVVHVRDAIHPQLSWTQAGTFEGTALEQADRAESMPAPEMVMRKSVPMVTEMMADGVPVLAASVATQDKSASVNRFRQENEIRSTVGVPRWQGRVHFLHWDESALQHAGSLPMVLMTPTMNLIFGFVSSAMLLLLFLRVAGVDLLMLRQWLRKRRTIVAVLFAAIGVVSLLPRPVVADDFPPAYLLKQLAEEVNRPPACLPDCASIDRLHLTLDAQGNMTARFSVQTVDDTGFALLQLPVAGLEFRAFVLDDKGPPRSLPLKRQGKQLLARLPRGSHEVVLQAVVAGDAAQLGIPLSVRRYSETVTGWVGSHVRDQHGWKALSFRRQQQREASAATDRPAVLPHSRLPAFFDVTREFMLTDGLYLETTVRRVSPTGSVETAAIPAWPQEVIIEAGAQVSRQGDVIQVLFNAGDQQIHFRSSLQFSDDELAASTGGLLRNIELPPAPEAQRTRWQFNYASQWELSVEGLPVIYQQTASGDNIKMLRPWPGETATLLVSRVAPQPGKTVAVQQFDLALAPHDGAGGALEIDVEVEATQAQTLVLKIPDATIRQVTVNGREINNEAGSEARIPLDIGHANIVIDGELNSGIAATYREPELSLVTSNGAPIELFNVTTEITMPRDRWVYHAEGRGVGPDFLFWSILPVLLLAAVILHVMQLGKINGVAWLAVMVGFTQANSFGLYIGIGMAVLFIGWLYLLKLREGMDPFAHSPLKFDAFQLLLLIVTIMALAAMADGLFNGLLGHPKMQVAGNGSDVWFLRWFNDRGLPQASVKSLPMLYYRIVILVWAIWLSFIVLRWIKYAWQAFSATTLYRPLGADKPGGQDAGEKSGKSNSALLWLAVVAVVLFLVMFFIGL